MPGTIPDSGNAGVTNSWHYSLYSTSGGRQNNNDDGDFAMSDDK